MTYDRFMTFLKHFLFLTLFYGTEILHSKVIDPDFLHVSFFAVVNPFFLKLLIQVPNVSQLQPLPVMRDR